MLPNIGYVTGRLREAREVTGRLREVGRVGVKRVEEVSETLREPGIITGYRHENCSVIQAVASVFNATNETVNFWTHFLATLYFMWLLASLAAIMPVFEDPYLFPFTCYMFAACCYPLISCLAHAFSCLSPTATHICFFIDYTAIAMYSWAVACLYYSYCFPKQLMDTWFSRIFLPVAAFNSVMATLFASLSRFIRTPGLQKTLRVSAFVEPYIWDSFPLLLWLYTCDTASESCGESRIYHASQFVCVIVASFFYGSHFPERLAPGRFDYGGHSHNILHVFSILGTNEQMHAVLLDLKHRRPALEAANWLPSPSWAKFATPLLILVNLSIVLALTYCLLKKRSFFIPPTTSATTSRQPHLITSTPTTPSQALHITTISPSPFQPLSITTTTTAASPCKPLYSVTATTAGGIITTPSTVVTNQEPSKTSTDHLKEE